MPGIFLHKHWTSAASIKSSSSLLSIVPDGDISVGFRPLHALLVGERIV